MKTLDEFKHAFEWCRLEYAEVDSRILDEDVINNVRFKEDGYGVKVVMSYTIQYARQYSDPVVMQEDKTECATVEHGWFSAHTESEDWDDKKAFKWKLFDAFEEVVAARVKLERIS